MAESSRPAKKKRGSHPPSSSSMADLNRLFSSPAQIERFTKSFQNRDLVQAKYVDCPFFRAENFTFMELLTQQGLSTFVSLRAKVYPELVRVFFSNLEYREATLHSEVKKVKIEIPQRLWTQLTGLAFEGANFTGRGPPSQWADQYDSKLARASIQHVMHHVRERFLAGGLTVESRLLHYVLVRVLIARASNYAQVLEDDVLAMWALRNGKPINWGYYVIQHMLKVARTGTDLPYAMLVTKILQHFRVPLAGEVEEPQPSQQVIGAALLKKLGICKIDNSWVHRSIGVYSTMSKADHPEDMPLPAAPAAPAAPASPAAQDDVPPAPDAPAGAYAPYPDVLNQILHEIRGLRTSVNRLEGRTDRIETDIAAIRRHLQMCEIEVEPVTTVPSASQPHDPLDSSSLNSDDDVSDDEDAS